MSKYIPPHRRLRSTSSVAVEKIPVTLADTSNSNISTQVTDALTAHFINVSPTFVQWLEAKHRYGQDPAVESRFQSTHAFQHKSLAPTLTDRDALLKRSISTKFRDGFAAAMAAVDEQSHYAFSPSRNKITSFVDLGCAPGGFSKWLLSKHADATGIGLSLPESEHGLPIDLSDWTDDFRRRYSVHRVNIMTISQSKLTFDRIFSAQYSAVDLVICGAVWRDEHTTLGSTQSWRSGFPKNLSTIQPPGNRDRLALSQLLIALRILKPGGNLLFVASLKLTFSTIDLLVFLRDSFERITPTKTMLHPTRSSYYLVCEGFKLADGERRECILRVEEMLSKLSSGVHRREDLDVSLTEFTNPLELAKRETSFVLGHLERFWSKQIEALHTERDAAQSFYQKRGGGWMRGRGKRSRFDFNRFM